MGSCKENLISNFNYIKVLVLVKEKYIDVTNEVEENCVFESDGEFNYYRLMDIDDYLTGIYGVRYKGKLMHPLILVIEDGGLMGTIYRINNSQGYFELYGKTRGYA